MKKDIEWLKQWIEEYESEVIKVIEKRKDELDGFITTLSRGKQSAIKRIKQKIDQLDEPEVLSQEWIDEYAQGDYDEWVYTEDLENFLVPKQELPVIPKYVADWIVDLKSKEISMLESIYDFIHGEDINDYMREQGDVLMRAWLDGFTIANEEGPKYYVYLGDGHYLVSEDDLKEPHAKIRHQEDRGFLNYNTTFTEEEIKDYDPRYWAFRNPVEELAND